MTAALSSLRIAFRVDASIEIGTGHVMRCLTLAAALREVGACCMFICRPHDGHLIDFISRQGFRALALPGLADIGDASQADDLPHSSWLGIGWADDACDSLAALNNYTGGVAVDWLVVDHYSLDARWEKALSPAFKRLMVIDDLVDRPHECDLLLDQNLGRRADDYAGLLPAHARTLLGPRYALLRPEFARMRAESLARRAEPRLAQILVTMGGVDKDDASGLVLDALTDCALPDGTEVIVVMGQQAPWLDKVRRQGMSMRLPTKVLVGVSDMAGLMSGSDFMIGAGGGTTWERCSLGLPSVIVEIAANQAGNKGAMVAAGAALGAGSLLTAAFPKNLETALAEAIKPARLIALSEVAAGICDGDGTARVLAALCPATPWFRDAVRADSRRIWEWRHAMNSAFRIVSEETSYTAHDNWFKIAVHNPERVIRILMLGQLPCGYLRFDCVDSARALVSVCLSPEVQGRGLGRELLIEADKLGRISRLNRLDAEVHPDNIASCRLFVSAGYERSTGRQGFVTFHRIIEEAS